MPRHNQPADLVCAFKYLVDLGVAHVALNREILHVAGAAEDLRRIELSVGKITRA